MSVSSVKVDVATVQDKKGIVSFMPFAQARQGTFNITLNNKVVGNVDVSRQPNETYVSVRLEDLFLSIEQMIGLMTDLKRDFGLSDQQRISIQQV